MNATTESYCVLAGEFPYQSGLREARAVPRWSVDSDSPIPRGIAKYATAEEAIAAAEEALPEIEWPEMVRIIRLPLRPLKDNSGYDWDIVHTIDVRERRAASHRASQQCSECGAPSGEEHTVECSYGA